jgi:hypothetical protein
MFEPLEIGLSGLPTFTRWAVDITPGFSMLCMQRGKSMTNGWQTITTAVLSSAFQLGKLGRVTAATGRD